MIMRDDVTRQPKEGLIKNLFWIPRDDENESMSRVLYISHAVL